MKITIQTLILSLSLGVALPALANEHEHPCKKIKAACESAGYTKGGHKGGKGLMKDCMKPIMTGRTVAGVTVDAAEIEACKAKKNEHGKHDEHANE